MPEGIERPAVTMQNRATFEAIKTDDPDLFVVGIGGHLGTRQRPAVENLVQRCRDTGKTKVIFEISHLESLAGSVATILGDFSADMHEAGHAPWFVGASPVVQSFLTARFERHAPRFAPDLESARAFLDGDVAAAQTAPAAKKPDSGGKDTNPVVGKTPRASRTKTGKAESEEPAPSKGTSSSRVADGPPLEVVDLSTASALRARPAGPPRRRSHMTLADAQPLLQEIVQLEETLPVLEGLLTGADLAAVCHLFCLDGDRLCEVPSDHASGKLWLPANGAISSLVRQRGGPVDLVDFADLELEEQEAEVVATLNAQLVAPIFVNEDMSAVFFVRQEQAGREYLPSEELAIDLLARQFGQWFAYGLAEREREDTEAERKLKAQVRRQRAVFRIARELHGIDNADQLVSRLLIALIGELGVSGAVFLELEGDTLVPRHTYGIDEANLGIYTVLRPERLSSSPKVLAPADADPAVWGEAARHLRRAGLDLLAPLCGRDFLLGVIGLSSRRSKDNGKFDPEYLEAVLHQAGMAAQRVRTVRSLEEHTLRIARTLMGLVDRRLGRGTTGEADLVSWYVSRLADRLNYDEAERRDLLYGAVLRDVGMIEISDLVLRSPRSLTDEEWKLIHRHPIVGADILRGMGFDDVTVDVVLHHHERFNGNGYPHGLRGQAIPMGARIVAVVESYVAMLHDTPYRTALCPAEARGVLEENWEMRYDPEVIRAFVEVIRTEPDPTVEHAVETLLAVGGTVE